MRKRAPEVLNGARFGRLTVDGFLEKRGHNHYYRCKCDCGNEKVIAKYSLTCGDTQSCGCLQRERAAAKRRLRPYESLYRLFVSKAAYANHECEVTYEDFVGFTETQECHYCGAGVKWLRFRKYRARGFSTAYNLDRKDNAKGYTKDNCVVCCGRCNQSRSDNFTYEEWVAIGNLIRTFPRRGTAVYSVLGDHQ